VQGTAGGALLRVDVTRTDATTNEIINNPDAIRRNIFMIEVQHNQR
jgi:hypothetical protein